jgi:hypothetical protein
LGGARYIVPTVLVVRGVRLVALRREQQVYRRPSVLFEVRPVFLLVAVVGCPGLLVFVFGGRVFLVFLLAFFVRGLLSLVVPVESLLALVVVVLFVAVLVGCRVGLVVLVLE